MPPVPPPARPPPRKMMKPPSIMDKLKKNQPKPQAQQQKGKPKYTCCSDPKPEPTDEGNTVCMSCFAELADPGNIVSEVNFSEDARGATTAQGGYVAGSSRHANTLGAGARRLGGSERDAGQNAAANAKRILGGLCPRLGLSDSVRDQAVNLYQLASAQNFSTGRRTEEVVAACLYAICRKQQGNEVLLIDISELQKVNVFRLGEVYKALCKDIYLEHDGHSSTDKIVGKQQQLEIESLIMKYCRKLEFGNMTRQVADDAARIMKRMKRDWMVTGRHPAGLCGACIIYAARMNNFRRTKREVVYVAKVADQTVAKRMEEFRRTRTASMSVEQFRAKGLLVKDTYDPPAIAYHNQRKAKFEEKKRKRNPESVPPETVEVPDGDSELGTPAPTQEDGDGQRKRQRLSNGTPATPASTQHEPRLDADGFAIPTLPASLMQGIQQEQPKKRAGRPKGKKQTWTPTNDELMAEEELEREIQQMLDKDDEDDSLRAAQAKLDEEKARERDEERERKEREAMDGENEKEAEAQRPRRTVTFEDEEMPPPQELASAADLEAEFANDLEVMNCLLPEMERKVKEQIWVAENEDWMRSQVLKEINARLDKEFRDSKKGKKGGKGRKKRTKMGDGSAIADATTPVETPLDASNAMYEKGGIKGVSRHINYEALKSVYGTAPSSTSQSRASSEAPSATSRTPSVAPSESESSGSLTPAPGEGRLATPPATQAQSQKGRGGPVQPTAATTNAHAPASPPPTQPQDQATAGADEDDGEGDENDYLQDEELDYGSDEEGRGGWLGGGDDGEDVGEDEYGPLSNTSLPQYDEDEDGY